MKKKKKRKTNDSKILIFLFIIFLCLLFFGFGYFESYKFSKNKDKSSINVKAAENNNNNSGNVIDVENNDNNIGKDDSSVSNDVEKVYSSVKPKKYKIIVDQEKQRVSIYNAQSNSLYKKFICSTGMDGADSETPNGTFYITEGSKGRGESFYNDRLGEGAYYWVQFKGNYLLHSIPFDKNKVFKMNEELKLGEKASHGCVRLELPAAKWVYDNIPGGTEVLIK